MKKRILSIIGIFIMFLFVFSVLSVQLAQASPTLTPTGARCSGTQGVYYECLDSRDPGGPVYAFQDISGNNPALVYGNNDDGVSYVTMPFAFSFYDVISDQLTISMNGAIKFGERIGRIEPFNTNLSAAPTYLIAPFWDDLDNGPGIGGGVYTDVVGTSPNRQFIVQWHNIPHYNNTGSGTFQVIFFENSTDLVYQYQDVGFDTPNFDWGASATIGIKGDTGTGVRYLYNTAVLTNSTAIRFRPYTGAFPEAVQDGYQTNHDTPLSVAAPGVLDNDTDVEGNGIMAVLDTDVEHGTLTLNQDGSFTYTPDAGYTGSDTFWYHAHDGSSNSEAVIVGIWVANQAPAPVTDIYTTSQSSMIQVTAPGVLQNDTDAEGDIITAGLSADVSYGSLILNADGSFSYTPQAGFVGTDSFSYFAHDGLVGSDPVAVTLIVENSIPVAVRDSYTTSQMTLLTVDTGGVLDNDTDAGGDSLTAVLDSPPAHGQFSFNSDGTFTYIPDAGFKGTDTFGYHANDGMDDSYSTRVVLVVENIAPTATGDFYTATPDHLFSISAPGVLANDEDAGGDPLTAVLDSDVSHGNLTFHADGSFSYEPTPGFKGEDSFTYHAHDGEASTNNITVTIQVKYQIFLPTIIKP